MIKDLSVLKSCELFKELDEAELSRLRILCSRQDHLEGATLFAEGREATHLYCVMEGQVALQKSLRTGAARAPRRTTVALCEPGNVVGWSGLVPPHKYTLSAVVWQPATVIAVDAVLLRKALDRYPSLGYRVMKELAYLMGVRVMQTTSALINEREAAMMRLKPAAEAWNGDY